MKKIKKNKRKANNNLGEGGVLWYRKKIVDMVHKMEDEKYLKMVYGYVNSAYREEKSRV